MPLSRSRILVRLAALVTMLCVATAARAQNSAASNARWDAHVASLIEAYYAASPSAAVNAGRHEYDGRLPDFSPAGLAALDTLVTNWRSRTAAFDTLALDPDRRFEHEYVLAVLDRMLWSQKSVDAPHRNPAFYSGALDPGVYLTRPYAPLRQRMQAYIRYARAVARAAPQIQGNLRLPLPRTMIDRGRGAFGGFASFYKENVPAVFASVNDSALQRELTHANDSAAAAMRSLDAWLEAQRATQTEDFAIGADRFREMLYATERVDTPLDELERIGRADLARNQSALRAECTRFAPGASLAECVRRADAHKPPENTLDAARRQLKMLRQYVAEHDVVSIPGTEEARVGESPPYMRYNTAYIQIPGPYDLTLPSTYYVAPPDPSWTPEQRAGYIPGEANLLFISVHEVWPGHFLQYLHAKRVHSLFGRTFSTNAFSEGWAHYTEEMMWDEGLGAGDPETHIGQLTNALLRDVRFLSAIGLHTHGMTVAESEKMFREEAFQGEAVSKQQAARGTFDPQYLGYTMGKLMIRKLRDDWSATRGGKAAWKQFHDQFLSYGSPPIPLVRRAMMGANGPGALF